MSTTTSEHDARAPRARGPPGSSRTRRPPRSPSICSSATTTRAGAAAARRRGTAAGHRRAAAVAAAAPPRPPPSAAARAARRPRLVERPRGCCRAGRACSPGPCALAGIGAVLWWAGALPRPRCEALGLPAFRYAGSDRAVGRYAGRARSACSGSAGSAAAGPGGPGCSALFGGYRGTVRRTGLIWVNPLLLRRRVDVRLRHWRSEPMPAVDANGVALRVVVLVVWRVRDTARATLGVEDHESYLRECVEAAHGAGALAAAGRRLPRGRARPCATRRRSARR